ncbi:MAG: hypothetical protein JWR22_2426, partial [Herminiimonas sp.]|nr:hypothetical protein [Herminiimonas sp.]
GSGPATGFILLLRQKNGTKKRRPGSAAPLRGVPTPSAPKSGSGGNSLRSHSRRFLSDFGTAVVAAYNGGYFKGTSKGNVKGKGKGKGKGNVKGKGSATATATLGQRRGQR